MDKRGYRREEGRKSERHPIHQLGALRERKRRRAQLGELGARQGDDDPEERAPDRAESPPGRSWKPARDPCRAGKDEREHGRDGQRATRKHNSSERPVVGACPEDRSEQAQGGKGRHEPEENNRRERSTVALTERDETHARAPEREDGNTHRYDRHPAE